MTSPIRLRQRPAQPSWQACISKRRQPQKKQKTRAQRIIQSNEFYKRYRVTGLDRSIEYTPLAFLPDEDKSGFERALKHYKRVTAKDKEINSFQKSSLYRRMQKAFHKVFEAGNDDYLAKRLRVGKVPGKGNGLIASSGIGKDQVIGFYAGQIRRITSEKEEQAFSKNHYLFDLPLNSWCIDGEKYRSLMAMINHSKDRPNVKAYLLEDKKGTLQVVLVALRNIKKNEELMINYDSERTRGKTFLETLGIKEK